MSATFNDNPSPIMKNRYVRLALLLSSFVIGLAAFAGALKELYELGGTLRRTKHDTLFEELSTATTLPDELKKLKEGDHKQIESPPTMDEAPVYLPSFKEDTEVWLEAVCVADCFDSQSIVGVTILQNGKTVMGTELQGKGLLTASAFVKVLVYAGNALEFDVRGADHLAKRKRVAFAAFFRPAVSSRFHSYQILFALVVVGVLCVIIARVTLRQFRPREREVKSKPATFRRRS